jgi:UDP-3-O-[3-hydroxymyristoyl] glucosamine N-acyltransferase
MSNPSVSNTLLLVGVPEGNGQEILETAQLMGYDIEIVASTAPEGLWDFPVHTFDTLPKSLLTAPAFPLGEQGPPGLMLQRVDRRWTTATRLLREKAEAHGLFRWVNLLHPTASISPSASLGVGVFVGPQVSISSNAVIGDFVTIGRNSAFGHDSSIGDYSRLGPGVAIPGLVTLGKNVVVGPGASFVNGVRITEGVLIGAGSVVTRHIRRPLQVVGNPARPLRRPIAVLRRAVKRAVRSVLRRTGLYRRARQWYRSRRG